MARAAGQLRHRTTAGGAPPSWRCDDHHRTVRRVVDRGTPDRRTADLIAADGSPVEGSGLRRPADDVVLDLFRAMVVGRRFDAQATALTKQGRLAVYPSSRGQEACQVGAVRALQKQDWLFPTYRDSVAIVTRGVDPVAALTLLRGNWHLGYDPYELRVAPQCTPLATNACHAVGFARAAALKGESTAVLVMMGDGATSEGDAHEAFNFAAVWRAPVVFLVQNNGYAISVPTNKQSAAQSFAHKGIGYGMPPSTSTATTPPRSRSRWAMLSSTPAAAVVQR